MIAKSVAAKLNETRSKLKTILGGNVIMPRLDTDYFLASYPRSGNTWLRAVLFYLELQRKPESLKEIDYQIIDIHYRIKKSELLRKSGRHIFKTHNARQSPIGNFLYVVRSPSNAILSYYNYSSKVIGCREDIESFAKAVVRGGHWPCSWQEHLRSWVGSHPIDTTRLIKYEDLINVQLRPQCMQKIADIFRYSSSREVSRAFDIFSIEEMQRLEKAGNRPVLSKEDSTWFIGGKSTIPKEEALAIIARILKEESLDAMAICDQLGYEL